MLQKWTWMSYLAETQVKNDHMTFVLLINKSLETSYK